MSLVSGLPVSHGTLWRAGPASCIHHEFTLSHSGVLKRLRVTVAQLVKRQPLAPVVVELIGRHATITNQPGARFSDNLSLSRERLPGEPVLVIRVSRNLSIHAGTRAVLDFADFDTQFLGRFQDVSFGAPTAKVDFPGSLQIRHLMADRLVIQGVLETIANTTVF